MVGVDLLIYAIFRLCGHPETLYVRLYGHRHVSLSLTYVGNVEAFVLLFSASFGVVCYTRLCAGD